jgi:branched-chain amino acid transport system substrate-binding protein
MKKLLLASVAGVAALSSLSPALAETRTIVVLQSLTGGAAFIGSPIRDGMVMAAEEINEKSLLGEGVELNVIVEDDATDRAQTLALVTRYAADPNVLAILGPTSGAVALGGANVANEMGIPLMTVTNTFVVLENGPWSFIMTQPGTVTIPYLVDYATDVLESQRCAMIGLRDVDSYVFLQNLFEEMMTERGVEIVSNDTIAGSDSDFAALATRIASQDQDCVYISASAPQSANIIIQLRQAGLDPEIDIMGHSAFASPQFTERGGAAVEGVYLIGDWVPGGFNDFSREFAANFEAEMGFPPDNWAAVGYGGMQVMAEALRNAGPNPTREAVRDALAGVRNVPTVIGEGLFSLDEERVPRVGMNVLVVQDGAFVPAPR